MRFLVLNHIFGEFTGSEINVLQVCEALRAAGHGAEIGTFEARGPLLARARDLGIAVNLLLADSGPALDHDVIWAHHAPVLTHVLFRRETVPCRVVFSSLSPLTPMESPPTYFADLDLLLGHSPYNVEHLLGMGAEAWRIHYFPNFAPEAFFARQRPARAGGLRRMAVVSNHPPDEVRRMARIARTKGVQVDFIGRDRSVFVDESVLPGYDLAVTIGKTAPYAFAQRVPLYCYDHFGGPGYIDEANFEKARHGNFCGRSFWRKLPAEELWADIEAGHAKAVSGAALDFLHGRTRALFSLETNLAGVCERIAALPFTDVAGLRRRHAAAGRLNDAYMGCLRNRLRLEAARDRTAWARLARLLRATRPGG